MARILVVDDEKNIRRMVKLTLDRAGHTVETAEDGPQGLEMFGGGDQWDLVIVDQRMPGIDGRDVIREMHKRDHHVSIIMATAFATKDLASEAVAAGAVDFLHKPFSADMLRGAVAAIIERSNTAPVSLDNLPPVAESTDPSAHVSGNRISYYLNGFTYFHAPIEDTGLPIPEGFDIYRAYSVLGPAGKIKVCIVGITPHVRMQIEQHGRSPEPGNAIWNVVCGSAMGDYLWEKAQLPPSFLPVYELTDIQVDAVWQMTGHGPAITH